MTEIPAPAIHRLWFGDCATQPALIPQVSRQWFNGGAGFDALLRDACEAALVLAAGAPDWDGEDIQERLARILLLDQVSRNIYRGTPTAFASDPLALKLCMAALQSGDDSRLTPIERSFLAMPLQHAEDRDAQTLAVSYFGHLVATARHPEERSNLQGNADYARMHAEIIMQFGRFPHRNDILGRSSTDAERAYLNDGAPRFGQ